MNTRIAADRLRDLQSVTDAALSYLPLDGLLDELLIRVRGILDADTAVILLLADDDSTLVATAAKGLEEEVERGVRLPVGRGFAGRVAARREAIRITDLEHAEILNPLLREKGLKALLGVPLIAGGAVLGVMHVGTLGNRVFSDEDVDVLRSAADRAALAIHGRINERERGLADALQRSLIPTLPAVPGMDLAGRYLPAAAAKLGGDWYDAFQLPGGKLALAIGDVVGRGFHAAALMGQMRSGLRAYALDGVAPALVLDRLSVLLRQLSPGRSATLLYAVADPQNGTVVLSGAGHPPPLMLSDDGNASLVDLAGSVPLGATRLPRYEDVELTLEPGATLVMYTDGMVERPMETLDDGLARLEQATGSFTGDIEHLCDSIVASMLPDGPAADDAALLVARALPLGNPLALELPADIESIPLLRRILGRWLIDVGAEESEIEDISVAFSEACANAAEHAYAPSPGTLEIHAEKVDETAVVSVRDRGSWRPPRGENRGRGLILMEGLMDSVEVTTTDDGTTVKLSRRLQGPSVR